jgi:hypothetical protein
MPAFEHHRALDPGVDWPFFDPDFHVPSDAREAVQPLTSDAAESLWRMHISENPLERHPMLLPSGHWLAPTSRGPDWVGEYNQNSRRSSSDGGPVEKFLRDSFRVPEQDELFFITMRVRIGCRFGQQ